MFYFFLNDEVQECFGNNVGDIFFDFVVTKRRWPVDQVKLVYFGDYSALIEQIGEGAKEEISPEQIIIKDELDNVRFVVTGTLYAEGNVKHFPC